MPFKIILSFSFIRDFFRDFIRDFFRDFIRDFLAYTSSLILWAQTTQLISTCRNGFDLFSFFLFFLDKGCSRSGTEENVFAVY